MEFPTGKCCFVFFFVRFEWIAARGFSWVEYSPVWNSTTTVYLRKYHKSLRQHKQRVENRWSCNCDGERTEPLARRLFSGTSELDSGDDDSPQQEAEHISPFTLQLLSVFFDSPVRVEVSLVTAMWPWGRLEFPTPPWDARARTWVRLWEISPEFPPPLIKLAVELPQHADHKLPQRLEIRSAEQRKVWDTEKTKQNKKEKDGA